MSALEPAAKRQKVEAADSTESWTAPWSQEYEDSCESQPRPDDLRHHPEWPSILREFQLRCDLLFVGDHQEIAPSEGTPTSTEAKVNSQGSSETQ